MKVISVQQPWAHLIVHGPKRIENRTWIAPHRGPLAIHASRKQPPPHELECLCNKQHVPDEAMRARLRATPMQYGAIIGVCQLVRCERMPAGLVSGHRWFGAEQAMWAQGPICWLLDDVRPLSEPIPAAGQLGLWNYELAMPETAAAAAVIDPADAWEDSRVQGGSGNAPRGR